jgi:hypothetical protein
MSPRPNEEKIAAFTEPRRRIVGLIEIDLAGAASRDRLRNLDEQLEYLRGRLLQELAQIPIAESAPVQISIELAAAMVAVRTEYKRAVFNDHVFGRAHPDLCNAIDRMLALMKSTDGL